MVFYLRIRWGGGADEFQKSDSRGDGVDNVQSCSQLGQSACLCEPSYASLIMAWHRQTFISPWWHRNLFYRFRAFLINISFYVWHVIHTWIEFGTNDFLKILGLMWWSTKSGTRYACPNISHNRKHREYPDGPWLAKSGMVPKLLDLMIDFPLALSLVPKLLSQTFSQRFHPHSWNLNLHAWRSSKAFIRRDFSFWSDCSVAHKISEVSEQLPPSDIYPPPPPNGYPKPHSYPHAFQPLDIRLHIIFVYEI